MVRLFFEPRKQEKKAQIFAWTFTPYARQSHPTLYNFMKRIYLSYEECAGLSIINFVAVSRSRAFMVFIVVCTQKTSNIGVGAGDSK